MSRARAVPAVAVAVAALGCGGAALVPYPLPTQPPGTYRFVEGHRYALTVADDPDPAERELVLRSPTPFEVERFTPDGRGWRFVVVDGVEGWLVVDDIDPRLIARAREVADAHPDLPAGWVVEDYPFGDPRWRLVDAHGSWGPSNLIFDTQTGTWTSLSGDVEVCTINHRYPDQMCCSYDLMGTAWVSAGGEEVSTLLGCRGG